MKNCSFIFPFVWVIALSLFSACQSDDGNYPTANFKVWGNCGMCKDRIEESVNDLDGVKSAVWNVKSKIMEVKYDSAVVKLNEIHKKIAVVGHDTELEAGEDKVYSSLHSCCKYKRKE